MNSSLPSLIQPLVNTILALAYNQQVFAPPLTYLNTAPNTGGEVKIVPIPLAKEPPKAIPIPLHIPDPTCLEWELRKKNYESWHC